MATSLVLLVFTHFTVPIATAINAFEDVLNGMFIAVMFLLVFADFCLVFSFSCILNMDLLMLD